MEILFFFHVRSEGEKKNFYRLEAIIIKLDEEDIRRNRWLKRRFCY
jgi:hypothetical protein